MHKGSEILHKDGFHGNKTYSFTPRNVVRVDSGCIQTDIYRFYFNPKCLYRLQNCPVRTAVTWTEDYAREYILWKESIMSATIALNTS